DEYSPDKEAQIMFKHGYLSPLERVADAARVRCDLELVFFHLFRFPAAQRPDEQTDQEESTRRQQQQAVADVPATVGDQRQDFKTEQAAGAQQLTHHTHTQQHDAVAQAIGEAVHPGHHRRVLHGERFGAPHHDTVGDDQADKHGHLTADVIGVGTQELVYHNHQGGDDGHLHDDADAGGNLVPDRAHEEAREGGHQRQRHAHGQRGGELGGHRQGGTDAQNLQRNRVVVEDRLAQDVLFLQ